MENNIREKILKILDKKPIPTSQIALMVGRNYYLVRSELENMKKEGLVECIETPNSKYWKKV